MPQKIEEKPLHTMYDAATINWKQWHKYFTFYFIFYNICTPFLEHIFV